MKIVFFGTSNVALPALEALNTYHKVLAVITNPDAPVGKKQILQETPVSALAKELKLEILKPEKVKDNPVLLEKLKNIEADIFVVVSYGKILPLEIINLPKFKTINVHFSLLPKYRGASPLQFALLNGEKTTGSTIFFLDEKMDRGEIISSENFPIDEDDTLITLSERAARISSKLLLNTLIDIESGNIKPVPQNENEATYTKILTKNDGRIDWNKTAEQIHNQFRALYPWPGIWTTWQNTNIKILGCQAITEIDPNPKPVGTVNPNGIISCGQGTLLYIHELQLAGKNPVTIDSFLNGNKIFENSILA